MKIAIIGGHDYDEGKFEDFLYALNQKYPDALIVTGTAVSRKDKPSAEVKAHSLLTGLGHVVEIPDMSTKTALYLGGGSDLQLGWVLTGQWELFRDGKGVLQHRFISQRPDVIVTVGNPASSRAKQAADHWKKFDAWREKENQRAFHNVAAPPEKKKEKRYKATKKGVRP